MSRFNELTTEDPIAQFNYMVSDDIVHEALQGQMKQNRDKLIHAMQRNITMISDNERQSKDRVAYNKKQIASIMKIMRISAKKRDMARMVIQIMKDSRVQIKDRLALCVVFNYNQTTDWQNEDVTEALQHFGMSKVERNELFSDKVWINCMQQIVDKLISKEDKELAETEEGRNFTEDDCSQDD